MNYFLCCICLIFGLAACTDSQTTSFKKIEYASFDVNSFRTDKKDSVYIHTYYAIADKGLMEVNDNDDYHKTHTYYSFQLTQAEIKNLDSTFKQTKKLKDYLTSTIMEENSLYGGSYDFFRVTYANGTVDSICTIALFMAEDFLNTYDSLDNIIYEREDRTKIKEFDIPNYFKASLKSCYFKTSYLPEIKNPPPFKP